MLAAVGLFTLLVGAGVRLRRPSDPATLHFFWLSVAFFGVFAFSFSGRLDRLDWVFYWADAVAVLLLPPLFLHFTLFFPERPRAWLQSRVRPAGLCRCSTCRRCCSAAPRLCGGGARVARTTQFYVGGVVQALDRFEPLYLSALPGGPASSWRARSGRCAR